MMEFPVHAQLFAHQQEGAERAVKALTCDGYYALLYEMGCGKSLTALAALGRMFLDSMLERVLIVAPASVCSVWGKEFERFANFPFLQYTLLGERSKRIRALNDLKRAAPNRRVCKVAITNYEGAWRMENELLGFMPDLVICDESQRIKSRTARQSKCMHRLGKAARYRMILTGTPMQNSPLDFYSQFLFLQPTVFGSRWKPFEAHYAVMQTIYASGGRAVQTVKGYKNLDELSAKVYAHAHRVTKAEALDLPGKLFETREVELSKSERAIYRDMQQESLVWLDDQPATAQIVLTRMLRLQQIAGGFLAADGGESMQVGTAKLEALEELLQLSAIDGGEKVVIFARFVPEVKAIIALCEKLGLCTLGLWGEIPPEKRGALVERFQTDVSCKVFVAQIDTAGTGITLNAAHLAIFYSVSFNYATYQQATDRIHRIGMGDMPCLYIHLVAKDTIDEHVMDALDQKKNLADVVLDKSREILTQKETKA